jgi:hypothetical protein
VLRIAYVILLIQNSFGIPSWINKTDESNKRDSQIYRELKKLNSPKINEPIKK